jgi:hypothetical protein
MYSNGWGVPRDMQRAQSLFVKATLSHEPQVASAARENLRACCTTGRLRDRDDTTTAVVGVALVGLALLWAFSGSDESSGGGTSTNTAPCCGGSPSTSPARPTPDMPPTPHPFLGPWSGTSAKLAWAT